MNFDEGGFAVVAPNGEILALNDTGAFSPEEYEPDNFFMELALNYANNPSIIDDPLNPIPFDSTAGFEPAFVWHNGHRCGLQTVYSNPIPKFKLLNTVWHQWGPYNNNCSIKTNAEGNARRAPVGCGPLAAAQVMVYHQKPESINGCVYDWDAMNKPQIWSYETISDQVAHLCHQIGLKAEANYGYYSTGTLTSSIYNTLKFYGYNNAILYNDYSENIIINDVYQKRYPILIRAEGTITVNQNNNGTATNTNDSAHMWIIDGAVQYQIEHIHTNLDNNTHCYTSIHKTTYLHCNWGWGEFNDKNEGYYLSKVFDPKINSSTYNYNSSFRIIYNIY